MVSKIDHIGIAVESIEESLKLYTDILGHRKVLVVEAKGKNRLPSNRGH